MANEIYDSTWWGNTRQTASSIGTSTEMIQGQFNLTKLGDELIADGDFAYGNTYWSIGAGWSIANDKLTANNASGYTAQGGVFASDVSKIYEINLTVSDYVSGNFTILTSGGTAQSQQFNDNGDYTIYFDTNNPTGTTFHFTFFGSFTGSIDNVSVKEVRATTVEASKCLADTIHRIGLQDIQN